MSRRTPIYLDTEFILQPNGVLPLSLAFTTETGTARPNRELYLVITDTDRSLGDDFVQKMVLPYIDNPVPGATNITDTAENCREAFLYWAADIRSLNGIEFWADFCAHDWVVFTHLWGGCFADLPERMPHFCNDVEVIARWKGYRHPELPKYTPTDPDFPAHHAMTDARDVRVKHQFLLTH